ncbi:hypothetical protein [Nesterenkonia sp. HG001]|uniref:AMIN-like domain-containing (lipo)protein n=1 Tax=Nesterenkonia sp. HG001 TaxID=2983207 RepID=UPI002AC4C425|nr:hypothetical protein [Nesterenkonia sp. HG001]MDZ5077548.1 hypothetical protein [Nesterenkonia sp. HG001]
MLAPEARRTLRQRGTGALGAGLLAVTLTACGGSTEEEPSTEDQTDGEPADDPQSDDEEGAEQGPEDGPYLEHREGLSMDRFGTQTRQSEGFPDTLLPPSDGDTLLLSEVRLGAHDGYDRVVFDHDDAGLPGWHAEYVDEPTEPGSGHAIDMEGDAWLAISVTGLSPGNAGEDQGHLVMQTDWPQEDTIVEGTATTFAYEAAASYYIALEDVHDFDVFTTEDGSRLVVDILHR